jgi:hypothetical protein
MDRGAQDYGWWPFIHFNKIVIPKNHLISN